MFNQLLLHKTTELRDWTAAMSVLQCFRSLGFGGAGREEGQAERVAEAEYGVRFAKHGKAMLTQIPNWKACEQVLSATQEASKVSQHPQGPKICPYYFKGELMQKVSDKGINCISIFFSPIRDWCQYCLLKNNLFPWKSMRKFIPIKTGGDLHSPTFCSTFTPLPRHSSRWQVVSIVPTSLAIAHLLLEAQPQTDGHGQWGLGGEYRPWGKPKTQVQPPVKHSNRSSNPETPSVQV